jgi:hypothetical protein
MTSSTCAPQPLHVTFPHWRHGAGLHIGHSFTLGVCWRLGRRSGVFLSGRGYPGGYTSRNPGHPFRLVSSPLAFDWPRRDFAATEPPPERVWFGTPRADLRGGRLRPRPVHRFDVPYSSPGSPANMPDSAGSRAGRPGFPPPRSSTAARSSPSPSSPSRTTRPTTAPPEPTSNAGNSTRSPRWTTLPPTRRPTERLPRHFPRCCGR